MGEPKVRTEEFQVNGDMLVAKINVAGEYYGINGQLGY